MGSTGSFLSWGHDVGAAASTYAATPDDRFSFAIAALILLAGRMRPLRVRRLSSDRAATARARRRSSWTSRPNAVHAGTYLATARGYDKADGVGCGSSRPLELDRRGQAAARPAARTWRYLDIHDLGDRATRAARRRSSA